MLRFDFAQHLVRVVQSRELGPEGKKTSFQPEQILRVVVHDQDGQILLPAFTPPRGTLEASPGDLASRLAAAIAHGYHARTPDAVTCLKQIGAGDRH